MPAGLHSPSPGDRELAPSAAAPIWRTRLDPRATVDIGLPEWFAVACKPHNGRGGACSAVIVRIPEASNAQIAHTLKVADKRRCRLPFRCDSRGQANAIAKWAKPGPRHRRVLLELASAGLWGPPT